MNIAKSYQDAQQFLDTLKSELFIAVDIETTGLDVHLDKIVGLGISGLKKGFYIPVDAVSTEEMQSILRSLKGRNLLMFNASFDSSFLLNTFGVDLLPDLYCEIMLLKHTCDEVPPFGLKEIANKVFGLDSTNEQRELKKSIKANGGKANEFYKADLEILAKYCIQDCLLTGRLFEHYMPKLANMGLLDFFYKDEVMPLYKEVVVPMERRGVTIDMPKLKQAATDISTDMLALEAVIMSQLSDKLDLFNAEVLDKMFPKTTPTGKPSKWTATYSTSKEAYDAKFPGVPLFNLASKHHLKKLFFDILGETPLSTTDKGSPQVDDDFLESVATKYKWAADLRDLNKLQKINGTYFQRFLAETKDGVFYPRYKMHGTVSGRLSGDFQQLPRPKKGNGIVSKHNNIIRELVIARPGCKLISADYNSLEPTIFAHTSGDKRLQAIFNDNQDFYSSVAIMTEGLTEYSSDKSAPNYLGNIGPELRQKAKAYSLGLAYGMTDYKLQFEINTSQQEAAVLVQKYFEAFPDLKAWMDKSQLDACILGKVKTQTGRVRHLGQAVALHSKYGMKLKDSLALWKRFHETPTLYRQAKEDRKVFINLLNNAINFQVQGMAASVMNRAAIKLVRRFEELDIPATIVGQIHDELLIECPEPHTERAATTIKEVMESIISLTVPLKTSPNIGNNFRECK